MADFYVNYGSNNAKLLAICSIGKLSIKLHRVNDHLFVLSKNRHILMKYHSIENALPMFFKSIYMESRDQSLFNS